MSNPTTPFSWQMPTATDLVTDLPADFEVFGQAVATSMGDLLGGTTGQVLAKTSGTDMAFTWTTTADVTPLTTKGDLFTFTTVDARLPVGTNAQILVADSAEATGLKWATAAAGGKVLQVVNATYGTEKSSASSTYADTDLTATITPTLITSKILVIITQQGIYKSGNTNLELKLLRDATSILTFGDGNGYTGNTDGNNIGSVSASYLDSPATTSATTYKTQFRSTTNAADVYVQSYRTTSGATYSTITLLEIGA